jgi:hypothetical protein
VLQQLRGGRGASAKTKVVAIARRIGVRVMIDVSRIWPSVRRTKLTWMGAFSELD